MKTILFGLIITAIITACQSDVPPRGAASAEVNGKLWVASNVTCRGNAACYKSQLGIGLERPLSGGITETIFFHKVSKRAGLYQIPPANFADFCTDTVVNSTFGTSIGGDVAKNSYESIDSPANYLQITDINLKTGEIRGRFAVTYVVYKPSYPVSPDTIRVKNGEFKTWIR